MRGVLTCNDVDVAVLFLVDIHVAMMSGYHGRRSARQGLVTDITMINILELHSIYSSSGLKKVLLALNIKFDSIQNHVISLHNVFTSSILYHNQPGHT